MLLPGGQGNHSKEKHGTRNRQTGLAFDKDHLDLKGVIVPTEIGGRINCYTVYACLFAGGHFLCPWVEDAA